MVCHLADRLLKSTQKAMRCLICYSYRRREAAPEFRACGSAWSGRLPVTQDIQRGSLPLQVAKKTRGELRYEITDPLPLTLK